MISYPLLIGIGIAAVLGVFLLVRGMQRLSLRAQFMVLLGLGVTIGFIFLVMVQMRSFPEWFGVRRAYRGFRCQSNGWRRSNPGFSAMNGWILQQKYNVGTRRPVVRAIMPS